MQWISEPQLGTPQDGAESQSDFVNAPVSGGPTNVEKGRLTSVSGVSGQDSSTALIRDFHSPMVTNIPPCGGPTSGVSTQSRNQYIVGTIAITTAQEMNVATLL
jgi:3-hydroxyisobutyrate dehydrogenase